jgi:hypothetical protein
MELDWAGRKLSVIGGCFSGVILTCLILSLYPWLLNMTPSNLTTAQREWRWQLNLLVSIVDLDDIGIFQRNV